MKQYYLLILSVVFAFSCSKQEKPIVLDFENQGEPITYTDEMRFAYVDRAEAGIYSLKNSSVEWKWTATDSPELAGYVNYFSTLDEIKPVNNREDFLICASSGGVALVHIADKSVKFFALPMGEPHSAELLPDGNIVVATSVANDGNGNMLKVYRAPKSGDSPFVVSQESAVDNYSGHNVVWDSYNDILWATSNNVINMYAYDPKSLKLKLYQSIDLPTANAHELIPVYGEEKLWVTTGSAIYKFDVYTYECTKVASRYSSNVKSVSSGPVDFPTLIIYPKTSYYTDTIMDISGGVHLVKDKAQFYKARWML